MTAFAVQRLTTDVQGAHDLDLLANPQRRVVFFDATNAAVVLGSAQKADVLNGDEVQRQGIQVARRHSGGGAVLVTPGDVSWFDVVIPIGDPLFEADVSRSSRWLGDVVVQALRTLGEQATMADSATHSHWNSMVCFAGIAAGEVLVNGRKVVGISQRRTRRGARFQVVVLHKVDAPALAALFVVSDVEKAQLTQHLNANVTALESSPERVHDAVAASLNRV